MAYSALDDIKKQIEEAELIRLTDEERTGSIDLSKVDSAIGNADVEIDAYLGEKFTLPLTVVPAIVTKLSVDLAIRNLYQLNPGGVPEHRETQATNAVRMLEKIANGKLSLGAKDPDSGKSDHSVRIVSSTRIFSRKTMRSF